MNLDFHYYGTYYAARLVGYNPSEAQTIAYSAQFVDEFDYFMISKDLLRLLPNTAQTVQGMVSTGTTIKDSTLGNIWIPFHFLPGLLDNYYTSCGSTLPPNMTQMLCRPNGALVMGMIGNAITDGHNLVKVGLTMHVLADTWAHSDFAGFNCSDLNDVGKEVNLHLPGKTETISYGLLGEAYSLGIYCIGHGRLGHIPDYSDYIYCYQPKWLDAAKTRFYQKDNPNDFLNAHRQMIFALNNIRNGVGVPVPNDDVTVGAILKTPTRTPDKSEVWINAIKSRFNDTIPNFDKNVWKNIFDNASADADKKRTALYQFALAATEHWDYVNTIIDLNRCVPR